MILQKEEIILTEIQIKMLKSGWGSKSIENSVVQKITYLSDGLKISGYLAYPSDTTKKYPCIIWCRGGIGNAGTIDSFTARGIFGQLASWGYVVFATQYRGNYGSEGSDEFGGSDVNDILNLIPLADEFEFANSLVWGIEGWSRGGMMTYLALTRTNIFKAAIITGGIANLRCNADESKFMKKLYETNLGKSDTGDFNDKCESRSIVNFTHKLPKTTPILLIHGTKDERVLPHDSLDMSYKFLEHDIPFQLLLLNDGDHFLKGFKADIDKARHQWFNKFLINS